MPHMKFFLMIFTNILQKKKKKKKKREQKGKTSIEHGPESLRKHTYPNILKILPPKKGKFSDKHFDIFFIFLLKT